MIPIRSEQELGTGVNLATGRPRFVMRRPSAGRPSSSWRHCSLKSLTFKVFMPQVNSLLYTSKADRYLGKLVKPDIAFQNTY
jgi:hypothetical protein